MELSSQPSIEQFSSARCTNCERVDSNDQFPIRWHSPLCLHCITDKQVTQVSGVFQDVRHPALEHGFRSQNVLRLFYSDSAGDYWGVATEDWVLCVCSPLSSPALLMFPPNFLKSACVTPGSESGFSQRFGVSPTLSRFWDEFSPNRTIKGWTSDRGWIGDVVEVQFSKRISVYCYCESSCIESLHHPLVVSFEQPSRKTDPVL
jgi:hypothetical protein